ncbi:MAG: TonB-dependent receptor, partial [Burkholderiaceae bacterium]
MFGRLAQVAATMPRPIATLVLQSLAVSAVWAQTEPSLPGQTNATALNRVEVPGTRPVPAPLSLEETADTASSLGLSIRQLPVSVSVIDREEMDRRGLRTPLEATVTAVGVTGGALPGSNPRYSMRGFTDNNITLLRDGIRQNTMAQSSRPVDAFMLERIEVLKGPSSLMHGEGAVAGAINYVSRAPQYTPSTEILAAAGSYDSWRGGASTTAPFAGNTAAYRITGAVSDTGDGYIPRSGNKLASVGFGLAFRASSQLSGGLQFDGQREDTASWFGLPVIYDRAINTLNGQVRASGPANTATDVLVNARIDPQTRRFNYNLQDSFTDGKNTFTRLKLDWRASDAWTLRTQLYYATHWLDWRNSENYVWNPNTRLIQRDLFYIYRDNDLSGLRLQAQWDGALGSMKLRTVAGLDTSR